MRIIVECDITTPFSIHRTNLPSLELSQVMIFSLNGRKEMEKETRKRIGNEKGCIDPIVILYRMNLIYMTIHNQLK